MWGKRSPYRTVVNDSSCQGSEMGRMGLDRRRLERQNEQRQAREGLRVQVKPATEMKPLLRHLGALLRWTRTQRKGTSPRFVRRDGDIWFCKTCPTFQRCVQTQDIGVCF